MPGNRGERVSFLKGSLGIAVLSAIALLGLYVGILTIANSFGHAVNQFVIMWPWFSALVLGFGIQVGLYSYTRRLLRIRHLSNMASTKGITATGGISTTAMAACCVHHLSDVLPVIGFTGAAIFFSDYQRIFLLMGVLSNFVGITLMLHVMQKHGLMGIGHPFFAKISRWNMRRIFRWNMGLSIGLFLVVATIKIYGQRF
ncbi:MAG: hypothetical protein GTO13_03700 [Proteobacteria bacterium]|nr:hypothetical protein [Pseudomonadota bacterium]